MLISQPMTVKKTKPNPHAAAMAGLRNAKLSAKERRRIAMLGVEARTADPEKQAKAVKKGGLARAAVLTPERRKEIAQKAVAARWGKKARPEGAKDTGKSG
jgi:hypothetical protein